jgi:hypothetical protein
MRSGEAKQAIAQLEQWPQWLPGQWHGPAAKAGSTPTPQGCIESCDPLAIGKASVQAVLQGLLGVPNGAWVKVAQADIDQAQALHIGMPAQQLDFTRA